MTALIITKIHFKDSGSLFCLSSGLVTYHEVEEDKFNAQNIGWKRLGSFIAERIETNHTDFYATKRKNNVKTFEKQKKIVKDPNLKT